MHPFHISVTEIVHKPDEKVIQVSVRLFLDDFEETLQTFSDNKTLDIMNADKTYLNEEVEKYLKQHFSLMGKKPVTLEYLGLEFDRDVMWCYLEGKKVKSLEALEVTSSIMTEIFPDQENLVHIRREGKVKSLRLTTKKTVDEVNWGG
ncbi:MAG: DUF6702 family protein [Bacteroidota bacterium]